MSDLTEEFQAAIERIVTGKPENQRNKELAKKGKLSLNFSSVAREAGDHSRTLLSMEDCAYPHIRDQILTHADKPEVEQTQDGLSVRVGSTAQETLLSLRRSKQDAEADRAMIATRLAEADIALQLLRSENEKLTRQIENLQKLDIENNGRTTTAGRFDRVYR
ncbi:MULTISPECIES: hypothetical protein [Rhizobium]|uniref:hypothetical protein n=1 Tax=Rhizobium TaxID=379 RepID=UPI000373A1D2|nr:MULTISPECIES: hypothetical protein [Rhizobium]TBD89441.1 hypothetical protein ELH14_07080 [Rhizobium ruizarguesonis]UFW79639.1 hypothetical protein RlegSU303_06825 [Rhizobium leguminosarum bv. viciae]